MGDLNQPVNKPRELLKPASYRIGKHRRSSSPQNQKSSPVSTVARHRLDTGREFRDPKLTTVGRKLQRREVQKWTPHRQAYKNCKKPTMARYNKKKA